MQIKGMWNLFETMEKDTNFNIDIKTLNHILALHTNALKIEEINSKVLPLYEKYNIKLDILAYKDLTYMYLKK